VFESTFQIDLGDDIGMLRDAVRDFAQHEIAPRAAAIDSANEFPADLWRKLGELGVMGLTVGEAYGGTALGYLAHMVAMEEISRASASVGLSYGAHSNLCVNQIHRNGSEAQKKKYLPKLISGEHVGALAMSEPGAGSDSAAIQTTATLDGDDYVLNGTKIFCTNGQGASQHAGGFVVVWASVDRAAGRAGIKAFVVPAGTPGMQLTGLEKKLGIRASDTGTLVFENCRVPRANLLGSAEVKARGAGFKGRRAIAELLILNDDIRELIAQRAPARKIKQAAAANGTRFLREAAFEAVKSGETTLQEINRVTFVA